MESIVLDGITRLRYELFVSFSRVTHRKLCDHFIVRLALAPFSLTLPTQLSSSVLVFHPFGQNLSLPSQWGELVDPARLIQNSYSFCCGTIASLFARIREKREITGTLSWLRRSPKILKRYDAEYTLTSSIGSIDIKSIGHSPVRSVRVDTRSRQKLFKSILIETNYTVY